MGALCALLLCARIVVVAWEACARTVSSIIIDIKSVASFYVSRGVMSFFRFVMTQSDHVIE